MDSDSIELALLGRGVVLEHAELGFQLRRSLSTVCFPLLLRQLFVRLIVTSPNFLLSICFSLELHPTFGENRNRLIVARLEQ